MFTFNYQVVENDLTDFNNVLCDLLYLIDFAFSSNVEKKTTTFECCSFFVFTLFVGKECNSGLSALGHMRAIGVFYLS